MTECPKCEREFDHGYAVSIHWGKTHEGPLPEHVDTHTEAQSNGQWNRHRKRILKRHGLSRDERDGLLQDTTD